MSRAMMTGLLGVLIGAAFTALPARAAEEEKPKAYAVIVGINDFADKQIKPRKLAEADAKALYEVLTSKDYLDSDADHIKLLLGSKDKPSEPATRENILKAIKWAVSKAGANDLVIFAYFGQGAPLGDRTCYFASDSTFKERDKTAVAAADIEQALEKLKSKRFCSFVDVNFKGFDGGKDAVAEPNMNNLFREFLGTDDKEDHTPPTGRVVFLATNGLRQSLDLEKHGVFAHVLVEALKGAADKEGYEPDGLVTIDELVPYIEKVVPETTRKHGKTKEEKEQVPFVLGGRLNHFPLTRNPAVTAKVQERLTKFAQLAKEKSFTPEITEEGEKLLGRMPKLKAQQELRKAFQKLVDGDITADDFTKTRDKLYVGMKMKRSEAQSYANKVIEATKILRDGYVKPLNQGELVGWAIRGLHRRLDEKKIPAELKARLEKVKELKEAELLILLADVRERLGKREDLANDKDVDISLQQMMSHLDPYTNYIDVETLREFKTQTDASFTGIGVQIRKDHSSDQLLVVTPLKGSPAYKAGIKAGDLITSIVREVDSDGVKLDKTETLPTKGLPLPEAVSKILGKAGTEVELVIQREGATGPLRFKIIRGSVQMETVLGVKRKDSDDWDYMIDAENKIGYIRLTSFAKNTSRDLKKVMEELTEKGIKGFVLDLRFNPGGLLQSAVDISDLYIDDGLIVSIKPRPGAGREHSFSGEHEGSLLNFPMVCLVNGGSASGSEIVGACLQDHNRAIIIGERSYGKGSVQNIVDFKPTGGRIKLTTASFWRPNGKNLNKSSTKGTETEDWGVIPDKGFTVTLSPKDRDELAEHQRNLEIILRRDAPAKVAKPAFKDRQLDKALEYLSGQIKTAAKTPAKKAS